MLAVRLRWDARETNLARAVAYLAENGMFSPTELETTMFVVYPFHMTNVPSKLTTRKCWSVDVGRII